MVRQGVTMYNEQTNRCMVRVWLLERELGQKVQNAQDILCLRGTPRPRQGWCGMDFCMSGLLMNKMTFVSVFSTWCAFLSCFPVVPVSFLMGVLYRDYSQHFILWGKLHFKLWP